MMFGLSDRVGAALLTSKHTYKSNTLFKNGKGKGGCLQKYPE
jgi:hypothetical protein